MHGTRQVIALNSLCRTSFGLNVAAAVAMVLAQSAVSVRAEMPESRAADSVPIILVQNDSTKPVAFDIRPQPMAEALTKLGEQSGLTIIVETRVSKSVQANALSGRYTPDEALKRLLEPAGLKAEYLDSKTVVVRLASENDSHTTSAGREAASLRLAHNVQFNDEHGSLASAEGANRKQSLATGIEGGTSGVERVEEVVVTGSHIKGVRPSAPVVTITQEEMRLAGQNNLGELIRSLPQNFGGGQNPGVAAGATDGGLANQNTTGGSTLNLRGLGPDATLTLLNGARLPYDGYTQATDVAVIPRAAIERVEILLDGASAIYGSDAIGGVANIVLKSDYEGAEFSARYGESMDGGFRENQYSAVLGTNWGEGGFLVAADYSRTHPILARHRDYLGYFPNQNVTIYPGSTQKGALLSGHQSLGTAVEVALDAFYTRRDQDVLNQASAATYSVNVPEDTVWGAAPSVKFTLARDWTLGVRGFAGRNENIGIRFNYATATGLPTTQSRNCYCNETGSAEIDAEGPVFALPGGEVRVSLGGGYRKNEFYTALNGAIVTRGEDQSYHVYGEVNLPLVGETQNVPLVRQFALTGALRHENYDSFGGTTTPKIGMLWSLTPSFDVKATWGRSFKVPTLIQLFQDQRLFLYPASVFPGAPAGTTLLTTFGGNPQLDAERARIVTAGLVARPAFVPGLQVELGWFDIDYTDRVVLPLTPPTAALSNPAFADFVSRNPTVAEQNAAFAWAHLPAGVFQGNSSNETGAPYHPANVSALLYGAYENAGSQRTRGVDLFVTYATALAGGNLTASGTASWITNSFQKLTSRAPALSVTGSVFFPAEFRGRLGMNWSRAGFTVGSYVNYIDGVTDNVIRPYLEGGSMTTADVIFDYQMQETKSGPLSGVGLTLSITNLFDKAPPFMRPANLYTVNYDSTNYPAIGRAVSVTATKRF